MVHTFITDATIHTVAADTSVSKSADSWTSYIIARTRSWFGVAVTTFITSTKLSYVESG